MSVPTTTNISVVFTFYRHQKNLLDTGYSCHNIPNATRLLLVVPYTSQHHAGLQHVVLRLQQEITRPKARFKPNLPNKSEVDGEAYVNYKHQSNYKLQRQYMET